MRPNTYNPDCDFDPDQRDLDASIKERNKTEPDATEPDAVLPETLNYHRRPCDTCCGNGTVFDRQVYQLIKRWRSGIGLSAKLLAGFAQIPYTSYCKFEKGTVFFSEARLQILVCLLTGLSRTEKAKSMEVKNG